MSTVIARAHYFPFVLILHRPALITHHAKLQRIPNQSSRQRASIPGGLATASTHIYKAGARSPQGHQRAPHDRAGRKHIQPMHLRRLRLQGCGRSRAHSPPLQAALDDERRRNPEDAQTPIGHRQALGCRLLGVQRQVVVGRHQAAAGWAGQRGVRAECHSAAMHVGTAGTAACRAAGSPKAEQQQQQHRRERIINSAAGSSRHSLQHAHG